MELRGLSIFNNLTFWLSFSLYLAVVAGLNLASLKILKRRWDFNSKNPSLQLIQQTGLASHLVNYPLYAIWIFVSLLFFQDVIALGLGIFSQFVISLLIYTRAREFQNIPLSILNYNYSISLPKSQQKARTFPINDLNKKIGRRFDYWRGYGRFQ